MTNPFDNTTTINYRMKRITSLLLVLLAMATSAKAKTVETTLWEGAYSDGVELNSETVATFHTGDVLRVYVTVPEGGANFKICYKGEANSWSETTIPSIGNQWPWVNGGDTYADFTLTDDDVAALVGSNIYIYQGDHSTIDKVALVSTEADEEPTQVSVLWSGSNDLGDWSNFEALRYDGKGALAQVKVGDVVRVTFADAQEGWQVYVCDAASYGEFDGGYFDGAARAETQSVDFKVANATVLESIAQKGVVVKGKLATLTRVELLTFASSYDAAAVTIGETGMATWSSSKKLSFVGTGIQAYYASAVAKGTVTLTATNTAWDYQGYVLVGPQGVYTIPVTTEADYPSDNYLQATSDYAADLLASTEGEWRYIFARRGGETGFYCLDSNYTLDAHRAYLQTSEDIRPTEAGARIALRFDGGQTTGVAHLATPASQQSTEVYTLGGQRVAHMAKGLYVVRTAGGKGKKIIVK